MEQWKSLNLISRILQRFLRYGFHGIFLFEDNIYFEPVFWEHIYDIIEHEKPEGVIVQLGGQTVGKAP